MSNPYQFLLTVYAERDLTNAQVTVSENAAIEMRERMSDWKLDLPFNPSFVSLVAFTSILFFPNISLHYFKSRLDPI